jgi:CheY-like chemotaxis protein
VILPLAGKRLLLASEDVDLSTLTAGALARLGAEVEIVRSARAALAALARVATPAAAVLDLPLADLASGELLGAFARAAVPALVISGVLRGARADAQARALGARAFFEKPFPVDALAAEAARLVGAAAPPPLGEARDEVTGSIPLPSEPFGIAAGTPSPALDDPPPAATPSPRQGFAIPLPDAPRRRPEVDPPPPPRGELAHTSVPRILVALHVGQATGALTVARGPVKKIVVVEKGVPVYAASNVAPERFGAVCVRRGVVAAERLEALRRGAPAGRTAELLLDAGVLTAAKRAELVAGQVRAIAWSTFEWRDGTYEFQAGRPPAGRVPISVAMADLVLDGIRRTATLPRLEAELPADIHLAPSPDPAFELYALRIGGPEAHLLAAADGTKGVSDLVRLGELPRRDALAFLHACRVMRVLDEVDRVLASTRRIGFM